MAIPASSYAAQKAVVGQSTEYIDVVGRSRSVDHDDPL